MPPTPTPNAPTAASAQYQFLVKVVGVDGFFGTKTGGRRTSDVTKARDGGKLEPEVFASPGVTDDITVSRLYRGRRDAPLIAKLYPLVGRWRTSISVTPTDADYVPIAKPTVYQGLLTGCTPPEADSDSGAPARMELTFGIGAVK